MCISIIFDFSIITCLYRVMEIVIYQMKELASKNNFLGKKMRSMICDAKF